MKTKYLLILFIVPLLWRCDSNTFSNRNPYIPNYNFTVDINMSLPQYSNLQFPSNAVYYGGEGVRGIIIFNTGSGWNAFDAACPNQQLANCSTMQINGIEAVCPCDDESYSLFTGQPDNPEYDYPMKQYQVQVSGNVLTIFN